MNGKRDIHTMTELIGQTIRNYQVTDFVGKGGHGTVYKARHTESGQDVAIKIMLEKHSEDDILIQRLQQEARIIQDLQHPHIVPLIESWDQERRVYMVMPWIDGGDLRDLLERSSKLSLQVINTILTQICSALDTAHAENIIHRDLKPENILLDSAGQAYLTDFGFAKRKSDSAFETMAGSIIGSPRYLSPEQIIGTEIGTYTDIHTLGILIHEMLTGEHPLAHLTTRIQFVAHILNETLPPAEIDNLPPGQLKALNDLIARCTAKKGEDRYQKASVVAQKFAEISENHHNTP